MRIAFSTSLLVLLPLALVGKPAYAIEIGRVEVVGLNRTLTDNVEATVSLFSAVGEDVPFRQFTFMMRRVEEQTRNALEPFGYYSPEIEIEPGRDEQDRPTVTIRVDAGEPVRIRHSNLAIVGEGMNDSVLRSELDDFEPDVGDVLLHSEYEASKAEITHQLAQRGYFNADFITRRVEVTRADNAADIELAWDSGPRHAMGSVDFDQSPEEIINQDLLHKLVRWQPGDPYHQRNVDGLRDSLRRLDYFSQINIDPQPAGAGDLQVPIEVTLAPAPRRIETAGISYGTDSGAGFRLGQERRYINRRGHKLLAQLDYAQNRKTATLQYRIPAFAWLDGWYTVSLQALDEQTSYIDTRKAELVGSRSGQYNEHLNLIASVHVVRERWAYAEQNNGVPVGAWDYRYATFTYPSLRAEYINVDDRIFPRRGIAGTVVLRGGVEGAGSDASFTQLHARGTWFQGLGERSRLIVRGEMGSTYTSELVDMPPSLRYYAGGDRSIRGYEWREVGPQLGDFALGAQHVTTASAEVEHYFGNNLGVAAFADIGSAFDDNPDWHTGVGIGVRYLSPVGTIRLDVARGLDDPDSPFTIHLDIGTSF